MTYLLNVKKMCFGVSASHVLGQDLSFNVLPGNLIWIHGENGAGKSTFLKTLLGEKKYYLSGNIDRKKNAKIAYLSQLENKTLPWPMTLQDVIELDSHESEICFLEKEQLQLDWNTASGGERKKTLLTKVLRSQSDLLFLDEPFNHLDKLSRKKVTSILGKYLKHGGAVIMVDHKGLPGELQCFLKEEIFLKKGQAYV